MLLAASFHYSCNSAADDRGFKLIAPAELIDGGLLKFILPRFSLKNATRVEIVNNNSVAVARINLAGKGRRVFSGPEGDWYLEIGTGEGVKKARLFEEWLISTVGQNTVAAYTIDGEQPYIASAEKDTQDTTVKVSGDAVIGEELAVLHCGRCHMVNEKTRMTTIGSTPSFALLRGFPDWNNRFEAFYALRPHPVFTMVEEVTEPFDESRPPPIAPMRMTLKDFEAILAYVATIKPADLGSPLKVQ